MWTPAHWLQFGSIAVRSSQRYMMLLYVGKHGAARQNWAFKPNEGEVFILNWPRLANKDVKKPSHPHRNNLLSFWIASGDQHVFACMERLQHVGEELFFFGLDKVNTQMRILQSFLRIVKDKNLHFKLQWLIQVRVSLRNVKTFRK